MRIGDVEIGDQPKIVASVGADARDMLGNPSMTLDLADLVEIRLDLLDNDNSVDLTPFLTEIKSKLDQPIIATSRHQSEGGEFHESEGLRLSQLWEAIEVADAVDIELGAEIRDSIMKAAEREDIPVILSYHNFWKTPPKEFLLELVDTMFEDGGDIAKIAVMPETLRDVLTVYEVLLECPGPTCAIAMGQVGRHSRVIAPLYGSVLTYASVGTNTAPGQIPLRDMRRTLDMLLEDS